MKIRNLVLTIALAVTGTAFAGTTTVDVTKDTPHGTVTKHVVKVHNNHHRHVVKHKVVYRAPVRHHRHHVATSHHRDQVARRKVTVEHHG